VIQQVVMRWSPAIAVAVLAALVAVGHVAAADGAREEATPRAQRVGCDRAVGTFGRREVFIGTVGAVRAVLNYADPDGLEPFRNPDGPGYGFKAPLAVRRGKVVTIAIARPDRDWAGISIDGRRPADRWLFTACPRPAPRSVDPYERHWSSWAGGFAVKRLGCVHVVARERGKRRIHRATLSFGMRDACD
jgi:hypothetical protein